MAMFRKARWESRDSFKESGTNPVVRFNPVVD